MRAGRGRAQPHMHAVSGYSVPTVYANNYRYSAMGYTTILEGAMAPMEARHTHEEFRHMTLHDTMANTLFDVSAVRWSREISTFTVRSNT